MRAALAEPEPGQALGHPPAAIRFGRSLGSAALSMRSAWTRHAPGARLPRGGVSEGRRAEEDGAGGGQSWEPGGARRRRRAAAKGGEGAGGARQSSRRLESGRRLIIELIDKCLSYSKQESFTRNLIL